MHSFRFRPDLGGILYFSLVVLGLVVPAAAQNLANLFPDPVVARGKGVLVRRSELDDAFIAYKANMAAREQPILESQRAAREAELLDRLIVTQLLINRTTEADRAIARTNAARVLADSKKGASDETFVRNLKTLGMSAEKFNVRIMEQAMAEAVLDRELRSQVAIAPAQVEEFYQTGSDLAVKAAEADLERFKKDPAISADQIAQARERIEQFKKSNLARLNEPEKVRVSHVFLATRDRDTEQELSASQMLAKRKQIENIQARVKAGEDFNQLITAYSEDRSLADTHGEYTFTRDARYAPEFKAAAFSLQPGQLSDIVTTTFGYHLIKLHEKVPARKTSLKDSFVDIKSFLNEQELQRRMPEYFTQLKKEAGLEILDSRYQITSPKGPEPLPKRS